MFRRLAVFVGGFTLEAAQQVACDATMDAWEVLDHLGALVDKSSSPREATIHRAIGCWRPVARMRGAVAAAGETEALARRHAQSSLRCSRRPSLSGGKYGPR